MPAFPSAEEQLIAANRLLLAVNQLRDCAVNFDKHSSSPHAQDRLAPITHWLSEFEATSQQQLCQGTSTQTKLLSLLHLCRGQQTQGCTVSQQLIDAIEVAVRAITEHERIQQAIQRGVEQAVYDFAYGLSHEINNPLANISARAQQLMTELSDERARKSLATIVDQSMRAYEMLAEMMQVVKPKALEISSINLLAVMERVVEFIQPKCLEQQVELLIEPPAPALYVHSNAKALEETFQSLIQNALDAGRPGTSIEWTVHAIGPAASGPLSSQFGLSQYPNVKESEFSAHHQGTSSPSNNPPILGSKTQLSNKEYIEIRISDTGTGLDLETANSVFNLYHSGREHGKGLGISLSKARRCIEASLGAISMFSVPNGGTTVVIQLPIASPPPCPATFTSRLLNRPK